jgi:hypothetical protein
LLSVFPAHAPEDAPFAQQLSSFLQAGFDARIFTADGEIRPGEDIISSAETGLSADILVVILSPASSPVRWVRERWEPIFFEQAAESNTRVAVILLEDCLFPRLLSRKFKFFDATKSRIRAMRLLKRWLWSIQLETSHVTLQSPDLESVYQELADQPGTLTVSGEVASRFVGEAAGEFEAVYWIPAHGRSLTQIAGELGAQIGMTLDGQLEENCRQLRERLAARRYLVIFDAPQVPVDSVLSHGRTSYLFTADPVRVETSDTSLAAARRLVADRRYPEAYDALHVLLSAGVEPETCARDLIWICEHWGRIDEANTLRVHLTASPLQQLRLF